MSWESDQFDDQPWYQGSIIQGKSSCIRREKAFRDFYEQIQYLQLSNLHKQVTVMGEMTCIDISIWISMINVLFASNGEGRK